MWQRSSRSRRTLATLFLAFALLVSGLQSASAANYTVAYDANSGKVGSYDQPGITTGTLPATLSYAQGTNVTVAAKGNLARQGFTFEGWNDRSDGTGTTYAAGTGTFTLGAGNVTLYAKWGVPVAARLIGNGGTMIPVANSTPVTGGDKCLSAGVRGITSDGTYIYFRPSTYPDYICKVTTLGVVVSVHQVTGLSGVVPDSLALVYGNGCLFIRKDPNTTFDSIWCIEISASATWTMTAIPLGANVLPAGGTWLYGNFIQFPDGRIGSVSAPVAAASFSATFTTTAGSCPVNYFCKLLRIYSVSGTGSGVSASFSKDFILADSAPAAWPGDDHGIATDGTYLYQVMHQNGYKVWALLDSGPSYIVFNGAGSGACQASTGISGTFCQITYPVDGVSNSNALKSFGNATYFGRAHGLNKYLIGDYSANSKFWLSDPATPPPGPGNPDITPPSFTNSDTFTVSENIATTFNAATITVDDSATITLGGGIDGGLLNIINVDTATAYIRFKNSPDFEGPVDVGTNNIYNFTIVSTDSVGNSASRTFAIVVTNQNEASSTSAPSISGNVYKGVVVTVSVTVNTPGVVRFFLSGKRIPGCLARPTSGTYPSYIATCQWKPPVIGFQNLTAELTPTSNTFSSSKSVVGSFWVLKRTTNR